MVEGRKYDNGKVDYTLIPVEAEEGIAKVFTYGAAKYARDNWKSVTPKERYEAAARRHLAEYRKGIWLDEESSLPHLDHAIVSLIMLRELNVIETKTKGSNE